MFGAAESPVRPIRANDVAHVTGGRVVGVLGAGLAGYLIGTFPSADVAARVASRGEVDLREHGSGNPGGLNAARVLGKRWGAAVMAADIAKGAAASGVGRRLGGDTGSYLAGTASVAGHIWPVWNGFRGGKGVAAAAGSCLMNFPPYFPVDLAIAAGGARTSGSSERAIQVAAVTRTAAAVVWWRRCLPNGWGPRPTVALPLSTAATSVMVVVKFRAARLAAARDGVTPVS